MKRGLGAAVLILAAACALLAQARSSVEQQLIDLDRASNDAQVRKDRATLERLWSDDYLYTHSNGSVATKAEDIADTMSGMSWTAARLDEMKVRVYGDVGIVTGRLTMVGTSKAYASGARRFTDIFVRRDGRWQLAGGQATMEPGVPVSAAGTPPRDDREAVLAVVKQLFDGMRAADAAKLRAVFHPSAQLFSSSIKDGTPQVTVESADAFVAAVTRPHDEVYDERTRNEVVHIDGGFASVWAEYAFYRGSTFNHCGIDAFHLARDTEGWTIVSIGDTRRTEPCEGWPR